MEKDENPPLFDLAIIGGGIAGAGIARDSALRGIKTVLFEKNTFGSGTSSKSSKLIHGGIRYLEIAWKEALRGDFGSAWKNFIFVFQSLRESRILARIAPGIVKPIALLVPLYKGSGQNIFTTALGALFYAFLGLITGKGKLPQIFWNAKDVLKMEPDLKAEGLEGAVVVWDHTTDDRQLVQQTINSAIKNGAAAYENAAVISYAWHAEKNTFSIQLQREGRPETFWARKLVNAAGPWIDKVRKSGGAREEDYIYPVAGSHIEIPDFTQNSLILQAQDNRIFFVIRRGEKARVGTTERFEPDPDRAEPAPEEIDYLLGQLRFYFPGRSFDKKNILSADAGIRPLVRPAHAKNAHDISREHEIRIDSAGVIHVPGVKLTDHRRAAEETVDLIAKDLIRVVPNIRLQSLTASLPL